MTDHPSLEGLREALIERLWHDYELYPDAPMGEAPLSRGELAEIIDTYLQAQADYLRTHGVGWFGEALVRAEGMVATTPCDAPMYGHPPLNRCARLRGHAGPHSNTSETADIVFRLVPVLSEAGEGNE